MNLKSPSILSIITFVVVILSYSPMVQGQLLAEDSKIDLTKINLPEGFKIEVFAEVPGARQMALGQSMGNVFVGTVGDKVYGISDKSRD